MSQKYSKIVVKIDVSNLAGATSGIWILHDATVENSQEGQNFVLVSTRALDQVITFKDVASATAWANEAQGTINGTTVTNSYQFDGTVHGDIETKDILEYVK